MPAPGSWPKQGQKNGDERGLLSPGTERSDDKPGMRRQSTVQFGGEKSVASAPGGVKGESKPPAHLQIKRKLSRPGLKMQESPFPDEARTVRLALQVHTLIGIDVSSSTYSASFTLHVTWEKTATQTGMPELRLQNATAMERVDSEVETLPPAEDGSQGTVMYAKCFFRATLSSPLNLAFYPFDLQYLRLVVAVGEECRLRPLSWRGDAAPALVEPNATGGEAWRSLATFVAIDYPRQPAFARASTPKPQLSFTMRLQRQRSPLTWLCRLPLPLLAGAATCALWTDDESEAPAAQAWLLLLLAMVGVRLGLTAPYGQNATLLAPASAVDTCHLLACLAYVGLVLLMTELLPWEGPTRGIAAVASGTAWATLHALAAVLLMRRSPDIDDAAPSADAG